MSARCATIVAATPITFGQPIYLLESRAHFTPGESPDEGERPGGRATREVFPELVPSGSYWATRVHSMMSANVRQRVFRRMLAREAGTGVNASAIAAAARRVCERFAEHVTPLIGDAGMAAIYARSLHLSARNVRELTSDPVSPQGDSLFALLQLSLEQQEPAAASEAAVAVLATASELLGSFIGEDLTTSLLREAWPEDFAGDTTEDTNT